MGFVSIDFWTIIFQWCNLLILFLIIKKFLFRPVEKILKVREDEIHGKYQEADEIKREAVELKDHYTAKMTASREEAEKLIETAVGKAQLRSEYILKEAREQTRELLKQAQQKIYMEKRNAIEDAKKDLSDMAVQIAGKVIEKDMKKEDHEELIQKLIREIGEAS